MIKTRYDSNIGRIIEKQKEKTSNSNIEQENVRSGTKLLSNNKNRKMENCEERRGKGERSRNQPRGNKEMRAGGRIK